MEITIFILLVLIMAVVSFAVVYLLEPGVNKFEFLNYPEIVDIPYITMDVQGNLLNFIVDTGCGVSIFCKDVFEGREFMYKKTNSSVNLSAITSDNVKSSLMRVDFSIGKKEVYEDFALYEVEDFGNFEKMYGIKVHGILGSSFFNRYKCRIDYKKHQLAIP